MGGSKYKVDVAQRPGALNRVLKKMREEGVLVAGGQPGRKGAGCFKISPEEKSRIAAVSKAAAKKLKAQKKQGLGKASSKTPRKMAKMSAGKKAAAAPKKPAPKSNKGVSGKAKAGENVKKIAPK